MIIFLFIILIIIFLLFVRIKVDIKIRLENTVSYIEIKSLWIDFKRKGRLTLKEKEKEPIKEKIEIIKNKRIRNNKSKKRNLRKVLLWFFKNIKYDNVKIFEKIGVINPYITSMSLPIISLITSIPLNMFKINYNNFKYEIIPDYNNLIMQFRLNVMASFRIIDLLKRIINEKTVKNKC